MGQVIAIPTRGFSECFKQWKTHWENRVMSQGANFEGDWSAIVLCTRFLVSSIFFDKCLYFSYYMAGCFLGRLCALLFLIFNTMHFASSIASLVILKSWDWLLVAISILSELNRKEDVTQLAVLHRTNVEAKDSMNKRDGIYLGG